jgi:hypothetical protein
VARTRGIHGQALSLRSTHALRTNLKLAAAELPAITFSVGHPSSCGRL